MHLVSKQSNSSQKGVLNDAVLRLFWSPPAIKFDDTNFEKPFLHGFREFEYHVSIFTVDTLENSARWQ